MIRIKKYKTEERLILNESTNENSFFFDFVIEKEAKLFNLFYPSEK